MESFERDTFDRATGWWVFAGVLLGISGILNVLYGVAATAESHFFTPHGQYIFGDLKSWGWTTLILGVAQLIAAFSLFTGGSFGRWFGIASAALVAIDSLLDISGSRFWSLCVFALSVIIIYELAKRPET